MALLDYALTTLARVKTFLGISGTSNDELLTSLINSCTDFIENYCDRRFKQKAYTNELYNGNGTNKLLLKNYPVDESSTFKLEERSSDLNEDDWNEIDTEYYFVHYDSGIVERVRGIFYKYPKHYRITYTAGYDYDNSSTFLEDAGAGDLEYACWKLVSKVYNQRKQAGNIQSERLGDYSVTFKKEVMADPEIKSILDKYKRPYGA